MTMSVSFAKFSWAQTLLLLFVFGFAPVAHAQGERCGVSKDFEVQALEQIKTGATSEVEDGLQLLKHATEVCASFGDAWYYRSLFERKLGQTPKANYSLDKAKLFGSQAMDDGANPFVLAAPPRPGETKLPPVRNKWALVVGISQFSDARLSLHYTTKDAKDFAAALVGPESRDAFRQSNVHVLGETEVSTRRFKEELNWLARSAQEDDLVVIFVATHGTSRKDDTAEVNYIVTSDTDLTSQDSLFGSALAMVELSDIVRTRIKARRTVILLDTCHSGGATGRDERTRHGPRRFRAFRRGARPYPTGRRPRDSHLQSGGTVFLRRRALSKRLLHAFPARGASPEQRHEHDSAGLRLRERPAAESRRRARPGFARRASEGRFSGAASSPAATQVPALSSSELGGDIVLGAPAATP